MRFSTEEKAFMACLARGDGHSWELPLADRAQDRARQRLRRLGLVTFDRGRGLWAMTDAGRAEWNSQP